LLPDNHRGLANTNLPGQLFQEMSRALVDPLGTPGGGDLRG